MLVLMLVQSSLLELDNAQLEMKQVNIDLTRKIESLKQQLKDDRLEINQLKLDSANTTDALKQEIKDKSRELDAKVKELDDIAAQLATATTDLAAATADLKAYTTVSDAENLMRQTKEVLVGRIKRLEREIKMCREGIQSMSIERRFEGGLLVSSKSACVLIKLATEADFTGQGRSRWVFAFWPMKGAMQQKEADEYRFYRFH